MSIKIKYAQRALARARKKSKEAKMGTLQLWQNQLAALKRASEQQEFEDHEFDEWDQQAWQGDSKQGQNSQSIYPFLP